MPIVFIHGVAQRDHDPLIAGTLRSFHAPQWEDIERHLRTHLAPVISPDPAGVPILRAYWGDLGATFAWNGASLVSTPVADEEDQGRLAELDADALGRLIEQAALSGELPPRHWAAAIRAVWEVAQRPDLKHLLSQQPDRQAEVEWLRREVEAAFAAQLTGIDNPLARDWLKFTLEMDARTQVQTQRTMSHLRRPLETFLPVFLGDILVYLRWRGEPGNPGPIPSRVLKTLQDAQAQQAGRPGEPLIVMTHSMGGQIMYDLLTAFLPALPAEQQFHVDFWAATASQIGLFEELKLFFSSDSQFSAAHHNRVPRIDPRYLGEWWNVWNPSDLLSFRAARLFEGVTDSTFMTGGSLQSSHTAYLNSVDFYQALAARVQVFLNRRSVARQADQAGA